MTRGAGALLGAGLGALPAAGFAAWAAAVNPWFLDEPLSYLLIAVLPGAALGAALGALSKRGRGGAVALGLAMILLSGAILRPRPGPVSPGLLIFGVDGATWTLIDRWKLPHLAALQQDGARAVLRSQDPMFSPLVWTTMASGKPPAEHGIQGFRTQADHCKAARLWDIASREGQRIGIYKWLVTWPPYEPPAGGFIVPDWLAAQPDTWPQELSFVKEIELSRRLKRKRIEGVRPGWRLALAGIPHGFRWSTLRDAAGWTLRERLTHPGEPERAWRMQLLRVQMDRDVYISALHQHDPQFTTFTTYATDGLGHSHWGWLEECPDGPDGTAQCPPWAGALRDAYRQADEVLGEILGHVTADTPVLVVSDHGFRAASPEDAGRYFAPLTERLRERVAAEVGAVDAAKLGHKVTLSLLEEDAAAQKARLEAWLAGLTQGSTGQPFYRWEDLPENPRAVGLTLRDEDIDDAQLAGDTVGGEPIAGYVARTEGFAGEHHRDGILLARGPGVPAGGQLPPAGLLDVAPTALALLGLAAAQDMSGEALFGETLPRVPTYDGALPDFGDAAREGGVDEDALRALGYIE